MSNTHLTLKCKKPYILVLYDFYFFWNVSYLFSGAPSPELEEARKIAEKGRPVLGEHSRLEVIIEESVAFKVHSISSRGATIYTLRHVVVSFMWINVLMPSGMLVSLCLCVCFVLTQHTPCPVDPPGNGPQWHDRPGREGSTPLHETCSWSGR